MKLVLDTNVVMDLFHFRDAGVAAIVEALAAGRASCVADGETLAELARVVTYPEFGLAAAAQAALLANYRRLVAVAPETGEPPPKLPRCRDPDDQKFLQLAARAGADLLVTKDKALLRLRRRQGLGFAIATPAGAAALLSSTPR